MKWGLISEIRAGERYSRIKYVKSGALTEAVADGQSYASGLFVAVRVCDWEGIGIGRKS